MKPKTTLITKFFGMSFFDFLGSGSNNLIKEYKEKGAVVIDVRTPREYERGHVPGSILISIDAIPQSVDEIINMKRAVILVCHTGARANAAQMYLKRFGIDVINAGPWQAAL